MKKILYISFILFFLIGCQTEKTEFKNVNNVGELMDEIANNDALIVEISKINCPYCKELKKRETELRHDVLIYKYEINEKTTDVDMECLKNNFNPFEYVPAFYFIRDTKIVDCLVISNWDDPINELDNWIQKMGSKKELCE